MSDLVHVFDWKHQAQDARVATYVGSNKSGHRRTAVLCWNISPKKKGKGRGGGGVDGTRSSQEKRSLCSTRHHHHHPPA